MLAVLTYSSQIVVSEVNNELELITFFEVSMQISAVSCQDFCQYDSSGVLCSFEGYENDCCHIVDGWKQTEGAGLASLSITKT